MSFRKGEMESMRIIEDVSYRVDGDSVLVKSESGMAQGMVSSYRIISPGVALSPAGVLYKIR